jgi:hypothetical protein
MKKTYLITFLLLTLILPAQLQAQTGTDKSITKNFFIGLGGAYSDFQDTKYSDVRESGFGFHFKIGFNNLKKEKHFWELAGSFNYSSENASTHDQGSSMVLYPNIYFKYLWAVSKTVYVGGRVDAFDNYIKIYTNLNNNSTFGTAANHLYGSVLYLKDINSNWKFKAVGDLALIGVQKEGTGFAMSYSQNRIEEGGVDYQDPNMGDPSSYAYAQFRHIGNNFILKTEYSFMFKKRMEFSYTWEMRRYSVVSGYPTTWGMHNIVFRYNIVHREK